MNNLSPQRKKVVVIAAAVACLPMPGNLIAQHIHNDSYRHAFLIGWALMLAALLAYAIVELFKLKRSER